MIFGWGKKQKVGLTLSGGGLRGIAHIGILKALEEYELQPSLISGTSIGAIVGAFYAYGYKPDEIIEIAISGQYFTRQFLHLGNTGLFKSDMLLQLFQRHIPKNSFENLKIPLYVCATELSHGKSEIFHRGDLHQTLLASASVPYLFPPVTIGDKIYSDGGVMNNLPIEAIKDKCDFLIGAHVNASHYNKMHPLSSTKLFARIFQLALNTPVYQKQSSCNLFIDPDNLMQYSFFSSKGLHNLFQLAYEYTIALLETKGYNRIGDK